MSAPSGPASTPTNPPGLERRLGLGDAVMIGLGSMIGAGVFVVFAPAAASAGALLFVGLLVVAVVAWCNARSTARLAAAHPTSGGAYAYGRAELGHWWGFVAGWCFVVGKTASCAAMALAVAAYAAPAELERYVAVAAVVALTIVNALGVTKTAVVTRVIVVLVLAVLVVVVAAGVAAGGAAEGTRALDAAPAVLGSVYGVLQSAGLLFFAFAGYARIATLGEEVRAPERTIPRAVTISFVVALVVYAAVALVCMLALGVDGLAASREPLADVVRAAGWAEAVPIVQAGAALAALGTLLGLMAGIGRTSFAMAREGDLPRFLDHVHPRSRVPVRAELVLGGVVVLLVLFVDVPTAVTLSSAGVLVYYAVANLSAFRLAARVPAVRALRATAIVGLVGCVVLVLALPPVAAASALGVVLFGVLGRAVVLRARDRT
ncbi:amino acid permease [Labedella phragmitis]|uniref:Amino acid permease n=1 Tax=Labedella phragmitis TaxID=2498849 RepID=A0A444PR47_9MICO|nr:amino acid permease [Labedella phragmitis]RWZ49740.1 amino acid permease [Labedella phragmitis]